MTHKSFFSIKHLAHAAVTCVVLAGSGGLLAQDDVELFYSYYEDDARLEVKSPSIIVNKELRHDTNVALKYVHETFSKAAPEDAVDAVSGATTVSGGTGSGFKETRKEAAISGSHKRGDHEFAAGIVRGDEPDYESTAVSFAYTRELYQKNLLVSALYGYTTDDVYKLDATPDENFPKDKDTHAVTVSATQVLSPTSQLSGGYSYANVSGYQSNPLRKVAVTRTIPGGTVQTIYDESHPESRDRHTVFVRGTNYFANRASVDLNIALYRDDWGVTSQSAELRIYKYLNANLIGRLRYRYYTQGEADFYESTYSQQESVMTADLRLREFDSHLYGFQLTYSLRSLIRGSSLSGTYDKYDETNDGVSADVYQVSVVIPY